MAIQAAELAHAAVERDGFVFLHAGEMAGMLGQAGTLSDWNSFASSWDDLALDTYMADGGRYRRRRHAVFAATADDSIARQPHQPHYQSRDYNPLNGGIARWFDPIDPVVASGATMRTILACARTFFETLSDARQWHIEAHQFRIEARAQEPGQPTPEGIHRDGVDYVLVLLVDRVNIASGTTTVHALDGPTLGRFTLATPLDAALLDDRRVAHGVTAVEPLEAGRPAHRDVLVVTFLGQERKGR